MNDQLPALAEAGQLATPDGATIVPALIANTGDRAGSRHVEFFTANNPTPIRAAPTRAPAEVSSLGARSVALRSPPFVLSMSPHGSTTFKSNTGRRA